SGSATSSAFTVGTPPSIASFAPSSGQPGATVTISGANLGGATAVTFAGVSATYAVVSSTQISATVPASASSGKITVTTANGSATSSSDFTVTAPPPPAPTVTSFAPTAANAGA